MLLVFVCASYIYIYIDSIKNINRNLFCETHNASKVTERKHRALKAAALHVFRYLEQTTLASILNMQCEQVIAGHCLFQKEFLVAPSTMVLFDVPFNRSSKVVLECGELATSDLVYIVGGTVARAQHFLEFNGCLTMQCIVCARISRNVYKDGNTVSFFSCDDIVDAVAYRQLSDGSCRVLLPFQARFM